MAVVNRRRLNFFVLLAVFILSFVTVLPAQARIIPVHRIGEVEEEIFGHKREDENLEDRVRKLDEIMFAEQQSGTIVERVERVSEYVMGSADNVSLELLINTLEWSLFESVKSGPLLERIEDISRTMSRDYEQQGVVAVMEKLATSLLPRDTIISAEKEVSPGLPITVRLQEDLISGEVSVGDMISVEVVEDVVYEDYLIISGGTESQLEVTSVKDRGFLGRDAEMSVEFSAIKALDGTRVPVQQIEELAGNTYSRELAAGAGLLGTIVLNHPLGLVAGIFVRGQEIELPANSKLLLETSAVVTVDSIKVQ